MSVGYNPKNEQTMNQSLKVQQVKVRGSDPQLYSTTIPNNTGTVCIFIREPVNAVYLASCKVDSSNTTTLFAQSSISIIDSNGALSGINESGVAVSDQGAVKLAGLTSLAANDVVVLDYVVQEHL